MLKFIFKVEYYIVDNLIHQRKIILFLKNKIDLLKIYTEEHELEVLKLGITTLSKVKFILIEFRLNDMYLNYSSTKIYNFLKQNKFKLVKKFKFPLFAVEDRIYKKI